MGGEKAPAAVSAVSTAGSPPRGRGKVYSVCKEIAPLGITPAWAGKSVDVPSWISHDRDHPRVGGEKFERWLNYGYGRGSPPRGRGKARRSLILIYAIGITPAWAGKRSRFYCMKIFKRDHPRVGGEKLMPPRMGFWLRGSPPRGRGKAEERFFILFHDRITPAWAGKRHF